MLTNVQESFAGKTESIDISLVNSSFIPLSNTDANQVKVNVEYTLEDEKVQNQLINAVMEYMLPTEHSFELQLRVDLLSKVMVANTPSNFNCEWIYSPK
jgi:hypothetical protein